MNTLPKSSATYLIKNIHNNRKYYGASKNLYKRINEHFRRLKHGNHCNKLLQTDYDLYGRGSFVAEIIEFTNIDSLHDAEKKLLNLYMDNGITCYNISNKSSSFTEETKRLLSEMNTGSNNPNHGNFKTYNIWFINKQGQKLFLGTGMEKFCRENGMYEPHVWAVIHGKRKSHKGWRLE